MIIKDYNKVFFQKNKNSNNGGNRLRLKSFKKELFRHSRVSLVVAMLVSDSLTVIVSQICCSVALTLDPHVRHTISSTEP